MSGPQARVFLLLVLERNLPLLDAARMLDGGGFRRHGQSIIAAWWGELLEDQTISNKTAEQVEVFTFRLIQENETPTQYPGRTVVGAMLEIVYAFAMRRTTGDDPDTQELVAALGHLGALAAVVGDDGAPEVYVRELVGLTHALDRANLVAARERMQADAGRLWDDERVKALRDTG